jgi:two-component system, NtrC family, C4-dicarboxylate transport response regulator DctD
VKTVLLVDNDPDLLRVFADVLAAPGHVVLTTTSATEALRILATRPVHLLITEVKMPGLSGFELVRRAKTMHPNIHVVYMSDLLAQTDEDGAAARDKLARKPVRLDDLLKLIDRELGHSENGDVPC